MLVPDSYAFIDARPSYAVVIHKTASPGMTTAEQIAAYFVRGSDGREVSAHYVIGKDGTIIQCVNEKDGAGANSAQPKEEGRNTLFNADINWNLRTISIEHVDDSVDNSQPLTEAQKLASFQLVKDICVRHGIASTHVVEHRDLQPISKPKCAGNYPIEELRKYIDRKENTGMGVKKNKNGEVCDVVAVSQFVPNKTEFACGFFAASMIRYAGKPDAGGQGSAGDIEGWALDQYTKEYGADGANKTGGVSVDDMHRLLIAALPNSGNSHYYDLAISASSGQDSDLANIKGAIDSGYPVVMTVTESSIIDKELGKNPYFWGASGNHVFLCTGYDSNGDLIIHDPANIVGTFNSNSPRPQPRHYDSKVIDCSWASMCRMEWLTPFPANWNPITGQKLNQIPAPTPAPTPAPKEDINSEIVFMWELVTPGLPRNTGIFNAWRRDYINGIKHGSPVAREKKDTISGKVYQAFSNSTCEYGDKATWF